jgi:Amt family ammonium transporter
MFVNVLCLCPVSNAVNGSYSVGYAFAYGGSDYSNPNKSFIGTENFFLIGVEDFTFWLFQFAFAATR